MARGRRAAAEVETFEIPHEHMLFADHRVAAIIRRCCYDPNIVESVSRSCYLQGLWDGLQLALDRPELLNAVRKGDSHEHET